ncbi:MAG: putative signal transduction protein [Fibrobacteres bacterium]|nr:putative signal transduction protein [Fibrobacterota bacterium]
MNPDSNELKALVHKITDLPTLPAMMATITRLMQDPRTSAEELGRAIASDPALVSKVLKLVNSAFYGFPGRISTITQAIVILGFSTIRNVVLTTSVLKAFSRNGSQNGIDVAKFWEHSLLTGAIARSLAVEREANFVEETFIAGLLHDMGRIVLSQKLTAEFEKVILVKEKAGISQLQAEQSVLKLTHGDIGGWLARKWNLPIPYVDVMRFHHTPMESLKQDPNTQADTTTLIYMVHAADSLSKHLVDGKPDLSAIHEIDPAVRAELKIGPEGWERFQLRTEEEIGKARAFLEML